MDRIFITVAAGGLISALFGFLLLPLLRALKAGQSIREVGPTWHNSKAGTPMMGGLFFILSSIVCIVANLPIMTDYTVLYVLALSLCFGLVGFLDDFCKAKYKRNLGLTSIQKALLQMAVSGDDYETADFVCEEIQKYSYPESVCRQVDELADKVNKLDSDAAIQLVNIIKGNW